MRITETRVWKIATAPISLLSMVIVATIASIVYQTIGNYIR